MPRTQTPLAMEYVLLGLLRQQAGHGYDLHRRITHLEPLAFIWHIKRSKLYALLDKLEAAGAVRSEIVVTESRPNQKRYAITPQGERMLNDWIRTPVEHGRDMRQEFLARLYFAYYSDLAAALVLLQEQESACTRWLGQMQAELAALGPQQAIDRAVIEFRASQTEAMLGWLRRQQQELF